MKTIECWEDVRPYGVKFLTGEACGLGYRVLCDVTEAGRRLLGKVFGVGVMTLASSWNGGDAVGSILLPREMLVPIAIFALLEGGCHTAYVCDGRVIGFEGAGDHVAMIRRAYGCEPQAYRYAGTAGDRNTHQMSGRVE